MAYGFVKQSGGEIALQSTVGQGTCVQICLRRSLEAPSAPAPVAAQPLSGGVETILVVEDENEVRDSTVDLLAALGYEVLSSTDAEQAARLIMPGKVSSLELSQLVQRKLPRAQVLFTSGYAEGVLAHDGKLPPGVHLLHKPYTAEVLSARIRHLLRRGAPLTAA
jgi:hypothetical protein